MKHSYLFLLLISIISCDDNDIVSTETLSDEITRGAVLRTRDYISNDYITDDLTSTFSIQLEEQDQQNGGLLDEMEVYLRYVGYNTDTDSPSSDELLYETLAATAFTINSNGLPETLLTISFEQALTALGLTLSDVAVKDQFVIRLNLKLTDGRAFSTGSSSSNIIAYDTFFSSPFCYTVNVVESIPENQFTGLYSLESIVDGPNGETFVDAETVEVTKGRSSSTRQFFAWHNLHHRGIELKRRWEFNIVGDEVVFGKNQLSSPEGWCTRGGTSPLLLGPDATNGSADIQDDTVFELWFVEGYLGFDGNCDFSTAPSRYRFTKQ